MQESLLQSSVPQKNAKQVGATLNGKNICSLMISIVHGRANSKEKIQSQQETTADR